LSLLPDNPFERTRESSCIGSHCCALRSLLHEHAARQRRTARKNGVVGNRLLESGMAIITKPFEMTAFVNKVRELIDKGTTVAATKD